MARASEMTLTIAGDTDQINAIRNWLHRQDIAPVICRPFTTVDSPRGVSMLTIAPAPVDGANVSVEAFAQLMLFMCNREIIHT